MFKGGKSASKLELRELPLPGSGTRIVPAEELVEMLLDPAMRDAIDLIERVQGRETEIKRVIRKQYKHDLHAVRVVAANAKAIDLASKKSVLK